MKASIEQIKKIFQMIQDLVNACFYGELILKFESGKIVHIKKTESLKID